WGRVVRGGAAAVEAIARDRQADEGGVDPDLMHHPGADTRLPERAFEALEAGDGRVPAPAMGGGLAALDHHTVAALRVVGDAAGGDLLVPGDVPRGAKAVDLVELALGKIGAQG